MTGQAAFADALLAPGRPAPDGLTDPQGRPAGKRFDVYRNNVVVSLTEALGVAFPVVRKLLGETNFRVLARAFIDRHPPRDPRLMLWGDALAGFLSDFEPVRQLGYLPDVARLEQALRESYHAADAPAFDPAALAGLPPEALMRLHLDVAPSVRLVASAWPVLSIWHYNTRPGTPKPRMAREEVLVARAGFDPQPLALPAGGVAFVAALRDGAALGDALAAPGVPDDFDLDAAFGGLVASGALTAKGDAT